RIYIEDAQHFKSLVLTSLVSADQVIATVVRKYGVEASPDWTLFEICNDLGIERPLREWEIVTDVLSAWDSATTKNAIVMKKYAYRNTLVTSSVVGTFPKVSGPVYMESKPGRWQKRYCILRNNSLYSCKDSNRTGESLICRLTSFDVYTPLANNMRRQRAPTKYLFALRSTQNVKIFENAADHVRFFCVDKTESLYDWVIGLRLARSEATFEEFPEVFEGYSNIPAREKIALNPTADIVDPSNGEAAAAVSTLGRRRQRSK
ncbi:hypothetical protein DFJ73DRAFT_901736, partial [Zopfochytrium polystomum]